MRTLLVILAFLPCLGCSNAVDKPENTPVELKELVAGNNEFAFDLLHRLSEQKGNTVFSPYSISTALAMTSAGARGNTATEMAQTLHFTPNNDGVHTEFGKLIHAIQGADQNRGFELSVANGVWGKKRGKSFDPHFLKIIQNDYQAHIQDVDFAGDPNGARRTINSWVEEKTRKNISELFPENSITSDTQLVLANAIYFKGVWGVPFNKTNTQEDNFTGLGGQTHKVATMRNTLDIRYMDNADFQMAQLMYASNELSMIIILPRQMDGYVALSKSLSSEGLEQALARAEKKQVYVNLPRFKASCEFALAENLQEMGMKDAFSPDRADFTGMGSGNTWISQVMHKAFVNVDEAGTVAAAATGVAMAGAELPAPPKPILFRVDHPFLFVIRHEKTGSILFMGSVVDPTK